MNSMPCLNSLHSSLHGMRTCLGHSQRTRLFCPDAIRIPSYIIELQKTTEQRMGVCIFASRFSSGGFTRHHLEDGPPPDTMGDEPRVLEHPVAPVEDTTHAVEKTKQTHRIAGGCRTRFWASM